MKIYIQEHGWAGCIVVVASSEEEACFIMRHNEPYLYDSRVKLLVKEIPTKATPIHVCYGDS